MAKENSKLEKTIDLKKIIAIIQKNFIVLTRDRVRLIPLLVFPMVMILVFGFITGNIPKHIPTAIVVYEDSILSEQIIQEVSNSPVFNVIKMVSTEGEAKNLLDSGKARVIIEIPAHLEDDIMNGRQAGVTIIVDESDSSVSQTSKSTMMVIVKSISSRLSDAKIKRFQSSIAANSQRLYSYNFQNVDTYDLILANILSSKMRIAKVRTMLDNGAKVAENSIGETTLFVPPLYIDLYNYTEINTNYTYVLLPPGYTALKAQADSFRMMSGVLASAEKSLDDAKVTADSSGSAESVHNDKINTKENLDKPLNEIMVFSSYDASALVSPIIYEEKPAYGTGKRPIDFLIASIIALTIFQGAVMNMGRAMAGEKKEGSLTRVFLTPTSNATILTGTLSFYILFELFRSAFLIVLAIVFFNIKIEGSLLLIGLILVIYIGISTSIGLILSTMVKTEQQYMALAMLVSMPTMYLSGVLFPVQAMPKFMQIVAAWLPVTYASDALRGVMIKGFSIESIIYPIFILCLFLIVVLGVVFMVFKRDIE